MLPISYGASGSASCTVYNGVDSPNGIVRGKKSGGVIIHSCRARYSVSGVVFGHSSRVWSKR